MPERLTTPEAATALRRSVKTLERWRYEGIGPAYANDGRVTYARTDLEAWIDAHTVTPRPAGATPVRAPTGEGHRDHGAGSSGA